MMDCKPGAEHLWLGSIVGDWVYETECVMGPGEAPMKMGGREKVRSVGGLWVVGESTGSMPDGAEATMILTLGFDPELKKFVGTWLGSMMGKLWVYDISREGNTLNMESDGAAMDGSGKVVRYRDAMEIRSPDERGFRASTRNEDGSWTTFMTAVYRRAK